MGDGASVGDVYVDVSPRAVDFWTKFQSQTRGGAPAAGENLGEAAAKSLADAIAKGVSEGITKGGRQSLPRSTQAGEESGGKFADGFKKRVEAALKSLPKAQIGASATEAEQKIKDIRVQLEELSGKRVGVDISDAEALAEVADLTARLDELGAKSPSVQIKADAAFASAELAKVTVEAERVGALSPTIDVDADTAGASAQLGAMGAEASGTSGRLFSLLNIGIALGPAIVPSAAAATSAIAAVGLAAVASGVGVGVLALAIVPVVAAVKALSGQADASGQAATQAASGQLQMAGAIDQVRSARAALANTTANAAESERRAAEQVTNAERSLSQAQQTALRAQLAVNDARDAARRTLEDLSNQVADGALAQRQAILQLEDAQRALDAVNASPLSSARQRADAQLAYDQAKQQVTDLGTRQRQLSEDQTKATAKGVEGSAQVVAAQQSVTQSVEQVRKAEQAVADARTAQASQARQDAFAIAQAQQGVVAAQRAVQAASVSAGNAGSAAADKVALAFANLTPQGQQFANFLFSLKPIFLDLSKTSQNGLFPGVQAGIERLLPFLPQVKSLIADVSTTIGGLFDRTGRELTSPVWLNFFSFVRSEASPALVGMSEAVFALGRGFAGVLVAFKPLEDQVLGGVVKLAQKFGEWGAAAGSNSEVQQFIRYALEKGPEVARTVLAIAGAVGQVAVAAAPIGGSVLTGIRLLATVIGSIPVPVLTALLAVVLPLVVGMRLWGEATSILSKVQGFFTDVAARATTVAENYSGAVGRIATKTATASTSVAGFTSTMGGPLLLALTAVTALVGIFLEQAAEQRAKVDGLKSSLLGLADSYGSSKDASSDMLKSLIANDDNFRKMINDADGLGIGIDTVSEAVRGNKDALDKVNGSYDQQIQQLQNANEALKAGVTGSKDYLAAVYLQGKVQQEHGVVLGDRIRQLQAERDAVNAGSKATKEQADALKVIDGAQRTVTVSGTALSNADEQLYRKLRDVTNGTLDAASASRVLKDAHDRLYGAVQSQDQAAEKYAAGLDRLRESIKSGNTELGNNSAKARENKDTLRDLLKASVDQMNADIAAGVPIAEATRLHNLRVQALKDEAIGTGLNQQAVEGLVTTYGSVPDAITTQLRLLGYDTVAGQLDGLHDKVSNLVKLYGLDVATAAKIANDPSHDALGRRLALAGHATGGYITGPGSGTSDSIVARLSNGEYVIPAHIVASLGVGFFDQLIGRRKRPQFPGDGSEGFAFANGGPVLGASGDLSTWPALQTYLNLASQAGAIMAANPASYLPGVAAAQSFVLDQAGKPYVWASAGPDGYDCSGIVSAAYNVLHGRNPYSHTFSTMNEAGYFPLPGAGPVLTAGWSNAGERGGGDVGHTAGILGGLRFESNGGSGVVVGQRAIDLGSFAHLGHYDEGGWLPPGLTIARNDTGKPEAILTADQWQAMQDRGGGNTITIPVHGSYGMDVRELAAAVAGELSWQMR